MARPGGWDLLIDTQRGLQARAHVGSRSRLARVLLGYPHVQHRSSQAAGSARSGFRTKREAAAALAQALVAADQPQQATLPAAQYFTEWAARIDRKPATLSTYRRIVEQRVIPALGTIPLAELTGPMLTTAYAGWLGLGQSPTSSSSSTR